MQTITSDRVLNAVCCCTSVAMLLEHCSSDQFVAIARLDSSEAASGSDHANQICSAEASRR